MSEIIPIDKSDREDMQSTLEKLRKGINSGETIGFVVIALQKDGTYSHAHNVKHEDLIKLIGLLEMKKRNLIERLTNGM